MKTEVSAGGIVVHGKRVLVVRDMNDTWTFPKGNVEKGESLEEAAKREILEEVGISHLTTVKKLPVIRYMYQRNGLISKTVHYFIFLSDGKEKPTGQKEEGIHDVQWMDIHKALEIIGYPNTNKQLLLWTLQELPTLKK